MATGRAASSTPVPTTETGDAPPANSATSTVTHEEWQAMKTMLDNVYAYRSEELVNLN